MEMLTQNPQFTCLGRRCRALNVHLVRPREIFSAKGSDVLEARAQRHQYRPDDDQHGPGGNIPGRRFLPTQSLSTPHRQLQLSSHHRGCPEDVPITPT